MNEETNVSLEKDEVSHVKDIESVPAAVTEKFAHIDERRLVRKVDLHLLPLFIVLYLLSFLDRGNIGNAKIEGLAEDLTLTGNQYNMCLMVFFIFYAAMEVPSNMILKRTPPKIYISLTVVLFAVVMTCMGTVRNYAQLLATRALLGMFEAALFPGISYILSRYYKKNELLVRQSIFFSAASMAGAFSGLLAAAISRMDGVGGYEGWRWIFILEGLVTLLAGVVSFFIFPLFPANAAFLTEDERQFVVHRVQFSSNMDSKRGKGDVAYMEKEPLGEDNTHDRLQVWAVMKDWQCWFQMLSYIGILLPLYAISLFTPTIIKALGYSSTKTQLMSVPIYIVAAICAIAQGFASDYIGLRSPFLVLNFVCMAVGYIVCATGNPITNGRSVYAGIYIAAIGIYPAIPMSIVWNANNLSGTYKRAIGIGFQIGVANFSGAFVSNFYRTQDAPYYRFGHGLVLMFVGLGAMFTAGLIFGYSWENKKKKAAIAAGDYAGFSDEELMKLGDKNPHFTYRL